MKTLEILIIQKSFEYQEPIAVGKKLVRFWFILKLKSRHFNFKANFGFTKPFEILLNV